MAGASDYLENKVVDHCLGTASFTAPSAVYLALYSSDPGDDNSGSELSGNGYARQETAFAASASGSASNSGTETFTASGGGWLAATHFAIFDASTGGNLLFYGALSVSVTLSDGQSQVFDAGDVTVTGA